MKPAPFEYHAPETVDEVCALLAEHGDEAKVLAGGPEPRADAGAAPDPVRAPRRRQPGRASSPGVGARERHAGRAGGHAPARDGARRRRSRRRCRCSRRRRRSSGTSRSATGARSAARSPTPIPRRSTRRSRSRSAPSSSWRGPGGARRRVAADDFFVGTWTTAAEPDELLVAARFPVWPDAQRLRDRGGRAPARRLRAGRRGVRGEPTGGPGSRCSASGRRRCAPAPPRTRCSRAPRRPTSPRPRSRELEPPADVHASASTRAAHRPPSRRTRGHARPRRISVLPVEMTVNGERRRGVVEARADARRLPARGVRAHRHAPRLRARRVRRVHGAARRRGGAVVPACSRCRPTGAEVTTIEGLGGPDGALSPVQEAFRDRARPAVRLLHARLRRVGHRAARREPEPDRDRDPRGAVRQPVPLHRLPGHHPRGATGRGTRSR